VAVNIGGVAVGFVEVGIFVFFFFFFFALGDRGFQVRRWMGGGSGLLRVVSFDRGDQCGHFGTKFVWQWWILAGWQWVL
jgi:hypothetical protein